MTPFHETLARASRLLALPCLLLAGCPNNDAAGPAPSAGVGGGVSGTTAAQAGTTTYAAASCSELKGVWKLRSWACDDTVLHIKDLPMDLVREIGSDATGTETMRQFVPPGQTSVWYARTHGVALRANAAELSATTTAPAEACSTSAMGQVESWGPVMTFDGTDSCKSHLDAPGTPRTVTANCSRTATSLVLSWKTEAGEEGPCKPGQASVATWDKS